MSKCKRCGTTLHGLLPGTLCQECESIKRERDEDRERKEEREEQAALALSELLSESARSRAQSSEDLAAAAVYIAEAVNNPGDYIHPSCRLRTLKRGASRCPICHEDIDRQFWIDIETREREARQRAKEAADKAAADEAAKRAETESSNRWSGALFSIVIFFTFTLPLIERGCSEPQAQVDKTHDARISKEQSIYLAEKHRCFSCHDIDKKVVGPAWRDVAIRYRDVEGAEDRLVGKVIQGGVGVWGSIPEPPNNKISQADTKALVQFILSLE